MPKNYWMVVQTPENFEISKERGFDLHGFTPRQRRRAQRMEPDDRVLYYVSQIRKWPVLATITSRYFEDRTPIWKLGARVSLPYRVKLSPSIVLDEEDYIDALQIGPRLEYVKRWVPERWPLAFLGSLHLLPQRDFRLIEGEMKRVMSGRRRRRQDGRSNGGADSDRAPATDGEQQAEADEGEGYSAPEGSAAGSK